MDAIANEHRKTKEGNSGKYDYVDVRALERAGIVQYKMKDTNFIRIISPKFSKYPADKLPFYGKEIFYHSDIGPDGRTYVCLKRMLGERCPVCEYADQIRAVNANDERLKALWPSRRYLFFVYDVKDAETEKLGLHWFDSPVSVKDNVISLSRDRRTGQLVDVSDPLDGRDITFERVGKGMTTKYEGFELNNNAAPPKEWYDGAPDDFEEFILYPTYDQLAAAIGMGMAEETPQAEPPAMQAETGTVQDPPVRTRSRNENQVQPQPQPQPQPQIQTSPVSPDAVGATSTAAESTAPPVRERGVPPVTPTANETPDPAAGGRQAVMNRIEQLRNMANQG